MTMHSTARLGVVVPSGNAAAEPEIARLTAPALHLHTSRFPVLPGRTLRERLDVYNEQLPDVIAGFGGLALDAVAVACSGSHYLLDPGGDRELCDEIAQRTGCPVASSTLAILDTCADLGLTDVVLVSPYEPWLTDLSAQYWQKAGLNITRIVPVQAGERFSPYDVTTGDLVRQVGAADLAPDATLLFTGTGMFTFEALERIGDGNDRTLLTSNICAARWALKHTDATPAGPGGALPRPLQRLADRAGSRA
ncbi:maleate cis-trans isomerase family protein [Streptomyces klenkii]|uniref:maleate cis-trans isomerase family protein n=1 Tax=Streptomyces klenkii TaxID=1420899 RepID=UPI00343A29E5